MNEQEKRLVKSSTERGVFSIYDSKGENATRFIHSCLSCYLVRDIYRN